MNVGSSLEIARVRRGSACLLCGGSQIFFSEADIAVAPTFEVAIGHDNFLLMMSEREYIAQAWRTHSHSLGKDDAMAFRSFPLQSGNSTKTAGASRRRSVPVDHRAADDVVDQTLDEDHCFLAADRVPGRMATPVPRLERVVQDAPGVLVEDPRVLAK